MKMKKRNFLLSLFLIFSISTLLFGSATTIWYGTKNMALGYTGVSYYADVTSIFYNPSLLRLNKRNTFCFEYNYNTFELFNLLTLNYMRNIGKKLTIGIDFIYYKPSHIIVYDNTGNILQNFSQKIHIFNSGCAFDISKKVNYGFNFKIINNRVAEDSYTSISIDSGLLCKFKNLNMGLNFMNLLSTTGELSGVEIKEPLNVKVGISYNLHLKNHNFLFATEFNSKKEYFPQYGIGLEYTLFDIFSIRCGYNEKTEFTAGCGFKFYSFDLCYAYEKDIHIHRCSITYYFPRELDAEMKERYYNKGIMYYNDFNFKKSYEYFKKLYEADRYYRETEYYYELLQKRLKAQEREMRARLAEAELLYQEAIKYYKQHQNIKAMNKLIECLKKNKNHQDAKKLLSRIKAIERARINREKAKARIKEGDYYFSLSNFPSALLEYEEALKLQPGNKEIKAKIDKTKSELAKLDIDSLSKRLYKEGKALFKAGEYKRAIMKWREALAANPKFIKAKLEIKKAEDKIRKIEEERLIEKVVKDRENNLLKIAAYKFKIKEYSSALFKIEELLELSPNNKEAKELKQKIIKEMNIAKLEDKRHKEELEDEHLSKGIELYKKGETDKALYHLAMVVALNPQKGKAIKELRLVLHKMSEFESTGIAKDSPNYNLIIRHYKRGMRYYNKNEFEAAAAEWRRVLKIVPGHIEIRTKLADAEEKARKAKEEKLVHFHLKRAEAFLKKNKKDLALAEAKIILAILPDHTKAKSIVKKCMEGVNKEIAVKKHIKKAEELADDSKFKEAIQELKIVLVIEPENKIAQKKISEYETKLKKLEIENKVENNIKLAYKYFSNENYKSAKDMINKILEIDPKNKEAKKLLEKIIEKEQEIELTGIEKKKIIELYNQGVSYYLEEKYDKCIEIMKKIIAIAPDNIRALKFIEKSKQKIKEKATIAVSKKKKIDKKLVWQYYLKGINYYTAGDIDNAIKEWQKALKLDPENKKIKRSLNKAYAKKEMLK